MGNTQISPDTMRKMIRERYRKIAERAESCCGGTGRSALNLHAAQIGYSRDEIAMAAEAAGMGLGCGNPQAIAALRQGETVLDLGSGAGFDCFLAARAVGPAGRVIGVDMTDAMIHKARRNAKKSGIDNVEFRKGEIERLPVDDKAVDVIISNCVVNLSPQKAAVFREAYRILKPGGRLAIADVVAIRPLPEALRSDPQMHCACIGGAATVQELQHMLRSAGFEAIRIRLRQESRELIQTWAPGRQAESYVVAAFVEAVKPLKGQTGLP